MAPVRFKIVHELIGSFADGEELYRGRMRCRCDERLSMEEATQIAGQLSAVDGILSISVTPVIGSVLFYYRDTDSRLDALVLLGELEDQLDARRRQPGYRPPLLETIHPEGPAACVMELARYYLLRPFVPFWWSVLSAVWHSLPFIWAGIKSLLAGHLNAAVLNAAAVLVCLLRGDFYTARTLTLLLGVGGTLEAWTQQQSEPVFDELSCSSDMLVTCVLDDKEIQKPLSAVAVGDVLLLQEGSVIPVDGTVVWGEGLVDESALTGEPVGVLRDEGSPVFAGTVVTRGELGVRVSQVGDKTRLHQIISFVAESESQKAGIQSHFERLADMAVPVTFALAGLVWALTGSILRASAVLLVDYSCALTLATPLAVLSAMREGAATGCVVKGGRYLEALASVDTVVFDKAGTLTYDQPRVVDVITTPGFDRATVLQVAACLEEHFPLSMARAVVRAAEEEGLHHPEEHGKVQYIASHGVCALQGNEKIVVGSRHYIETDEGIDISPLAEAVEELTSLGHTLVYVGYGGKLAGVIAIEDPLRPEAADVIGHLHQIGVSKVLMVTGDDDRTAQSIANSLGLDGYRAQVTAEEKADLITQLESQGRHVLMAGDGFSDAPALSAASVGLSMVDGADLAQGIANVLTTEHDLHGIVVAKLLGMRLMERIHSNFVCTMLFNSVFLVGGVCMLFSPAVSAILHNFTTLILAFHSMHRVLRDEDILLSDAPNYDDASTMKMLPSAQTPE